MTRTPYIDATAAAAFPAARPAGRRSAPAGRRLARTLVVGLSLGGVVALSGCAVNSPVQTQEPYQPADGVEVNLGALAIRNLLVVSAAATSPGQLSGLVVNSGSTQQTVTITSPDGAAVTTAIPANSTSSLSSGLSAVTLAKAGAAAGALVKLQLSTPATGSTSVDVPVLAPTGYYATITPGAIPSSTTSQPSITTGQ